MRHLREQAVAERASVREQGAYLEALRWDIFEGIKISQKFPTIFKKVLKIEIDSYAEESWFRLENNEDK